MLTIALSALLLASSFPTPGSGLTLEGIVLAPDGTPAEGARVVVSTRGFSPPFYSPLAVVVHDERVGGDGRFACEVPEAWLQCGDFRPLDFWVLAKEARVFTARYAHADLPVGEQLTLRLEASESFEVRVRDENGEPVSGVRIGPSVYAHRNVPDEVVEALSVVSDAGGVASVTRWKPELAHGVLVTAPEHGVQRWQGMDSWLTEEGVRLVAVGTVAFEFTGDPPPLPEGTSLRLHTYHWDDPNETLSGWGECTLDSLSSDSPFRVTMARGSPTPDLLLGAPLDRVPVIFPELLEAGGECTVKIEWREGTPVSGRVVDEETGEPVEGATLWINNSPLRFPVVSGPDGTFSFRAVPGHFYIATVDPPLHRGALRLLQREVTSPLEVGEEPIDLSDIVLSRGRCITGRVVDQEGRPAAGAFVFGSGQVPGGRIFRTLTVAAVADERGEYRIAGIPANVEMIEIGARSGVARTVDLREVPTDDASEVELVLTRDFLLPAVGEVRDHQGRPVKSARAVLWNSRPDSPGRARDKVLFSGVDHLISGDAGAFRSAPVLRPDDLYAFVIESPTTEPCTTRWFTGAEIGAGVELVVGRLVTLHGVLLDESEQPVVGARVFVSGDAPVPVEATTDESGSFELPGVYPGNVLVFVEPEGASRWGRPCFATDEGAGVTIARTRELPEPVLTSRHEELEIAQRFAANRLKQARAKGDEYRIYQALSIQARLDPRAALELLDEGLITEARWKGALRGKLAEILAVTDLDEGLAMVSTRDVGYESVFTRLNIVKSMPDDQSELKLEILGSALAESRSVEYPPYRLVLLARITTLLHDLGERDAVLDVLEEGRTIAVELPAEEWPGFARATFAEVLARFDLDAAVGMVAEMADDEQDRHFGNMASRLAAHDPAAAEEVLGRLRRDWGSYKPQVAVCYRMAPVDLERARRIAGASAVKALAYGAMARALADSDPELARELLETAFRAAEEENSRRAFRPPCLQAGSLLDLVARLAPERLEEYLWRAIALRPSRHDSEARPQPSPPWAGSIGALAYYVARHDPELARVLVEPHLAYLRNRDDLVKLRSGDWREFYAALVEIDPAGAEELLRDLLPESAASAMTEVLVREGEERLRYVEEKLFALWVPGEEDTL
jgi:hypothetical protein